MNELPNVADWDDMGHIVAVEPERLRMPPEIQTQSGSYFNFVNPELSEFTIEDIANALSKLCRFTGHTRAFYCVTPDTKILTHDFRWIPAGEVVTGQLLWGFDENSGGHRNLRKWRPSVASVYGLIKRRLIEITMADGTILKCSEEHPFLCSTKAAGNQKWITAKQILEHETNDRKSYHRHNPTPIFMPKFLSTWDERSTHDSGWLAGIFDGEGSLASQGSRGMSLNIAQNPGQVLERIERLLHEFNFIFWKSNNEKKCKQLTIRGGINEQLRLLGSIRPNRLINNAAKRMDGKDLMRTDGLVPVVNARSIGVDYVVALETSTHTYFTEGYGSHNSVAQHSRMVSQIVPPEDALAGLLHDSSEAFLNDISSPLKQLLPEYRAIEKRVEKVILNRFGLSGHLPPSVKRADLTMLATEKRDLMPGCVDSRWEIIRGIEPLPEAIHPLDPGLAYFDFLDRFYSITDKPVYLYVDQPHPSLPRPA